MRCNLEWTEHLSTDGQIRLGNLGTPVEGEYCNLELTGHLSQEFSDGLLPTLNDLVIWVLLLRENTVTGIDRHLS